MSRLPLDKSLTENQEKTILNVLFDAFNFFNPFVNNGPSFGEAPPPDAWKVEGMVAFADGTNWSPGGGGEGWYRYDATLDEWMPYVADTWNDLPPIPIAALKLGGAGTAPTWTAFVGNTYLYAFAVNDEAYGAQEILHEYKEGTDLEAHLHWVTNGLEGVDKAVKWEVEYTMSNIGDAFPATSTMSAEATILANTPDRTHVYTDLADITGTGVEIGNYIVFRVKRIAAVGTAPVADPFALTVGFHIKQNTEGSRTELVK
jgi:hypothetical protein